jgi:CrcB protein
MKFILIAGIGSFFGGICRYVLSTYIHTRNPHQFPWGTFVVNILGCLLIGCIIGWAERHVLRDEWRLFLVTGVLGGFTTFSAFSGETFNLIRAGQYGVATTYVVASVVVGIALTFLGAMVVRQI